MTPNPIKALIVAGSITVALCGALRAHESWISKQSLKNAAGEWCCGENDCKSYTKVQSNPKGWIVDGELVPYDEALPQAPPDGNLTICRRTDGTRRCVFGLKPGI